MASYLDKAGLQIVWSKMKTWVDGRISAQKPDILNSAYPVGSIYISTNATSPASLFGGTWQQTSQGRFLLGASGDYELGETGGEYEHTLTIPEMPNHAHEQKITANNGPVERPGRLDYAGEGDRINDLPQGRPGEGVIITTYYTGDGRPHNNMPPYFVVYMWQRIS